MVRITMEDGGVIDIELNEEAAPITCENFKKLVSEGFYNGLTFHRVIPGFMIQGGCPLGNGTGGPGWNIKGEFAANGVNNPIKHTRGVISMARSMNPNSAGSQFFIMHEDAPHLDGQYAAFGKVVSGMDVVDRIASVPTDWNDKPKTAVKMNRRAARGLIFCSYGFLFGGSLFSFIDAFRPAAHSASADRPAPRRARPLRPFRRNRRPSHRTGR